MLSSAPGLEEGMVTPEPRRRESQEAKMLTGGINPLFLCQHIKEDMDL